MDELSQKVGIVVLNFNGADCLLDCLESLDDQTYRAKNIIVVDNDSTDESLRHAKERFPSFTYIANKSNLGFATGMNIGIKKALAEGASFVWLVNNDATAAPDALEKLLAVASRIENVGALSPLILEPQNEKIWFAKGRINFWRMRVEHIQARAEELRSPFFESEFLTGCALFIPTETLTQVGLLDEAFFLYYEDADFSRRVQRAGLETLVVPEARVFHGEKSRLNPGKLYFLVLSGLLFFKKHGKGLWRLYLPLYATIRRIKNVIDTVRGRDEAQSVRRAYDDFYHG